MIKKVLIINRGVETDNLGDQAIHAVLKGHFRKRNFSVEEANYTMFFQRTKSNRFIAIITNLVKMVNIAKKEYDFILIGGGQLIQNNNSFPISFYLWTLIVSLFSKNKIHLFGVGITSKFPWLKRFFFNRGFSRVEKIIVRDLQSQENLKMVFQKTSVIVPDVVFSISSFYKLQKHNVGRSKILFGITNYSSIKRYGYKKMTEEEYLNEQCHLFLSKAIEGEISLIYNTISDYNYSLKFKDFLQNKFSTNINFEKIESLEDYLKIVSNSDLVISSRMHALIIAKSFGVPVLPVIRNQKLLSFKVEYLEKDVSGLVKEIEEGIDKLIYK